ncbi:Tryptophan--tRNA ligase, mitochondrial [Blyttiomyces sp. JEL0837]|nr:Tryptophan--tRNA ligase, mitochondrial [Blyttiomyces sp. JEL0837]
MPVSTLQSKNNCPTEPYGLNTLRIQGHHFDIPAIPEPQLPPPEQRHLVANLELRAFMPDHLDFVAYFARYDAHKRQIPTAPGVIHLPTITKKWNVTRGPFVHDKTKDVFEQKTYRRLVQAFNTDPAVVSQWVAYVNQNLPAGVELHVESFEWESADGIKDRVKALATAEADQEKKRLERTQGAVRDATAAVDSEAKDSEDVKAKAEALIKKFGGGAAAPAASGSGDVSAKGKPQKGGEKQPAGDAAKGKPQKGGDKPPAADAPKGKPQGKPDGAGEKGGDKNKKK